MNKGFGEGGEEKKCILAHLIQIWLGFYTVARQLTL